MLPTNPILDVPLTNVLKLEIALSLQQVLRVYTIGNLVDAWQDPRDQRRIEQLFENPEQARHAVSVCANWLGFDTFAMHQAHTVHGDPWLPGEITLAMPQAGRPELDS
ncbi:MAG: hypothetical protein H7144_17035 [Burkholderiales bacterium]|nr:hypothetical protein [Phycisphaerae bacterium]